MNKLVELNYEAAAKEYVDACSSSIDKRCCMGCKEHGSCEDSCSKDRCEDCERLPF